MLKKRIEGGLFYANEAFWRQLREVLYIFFS